MVYTLRFSSSKCSLFHNSSVFGSCIIQILYTGCAKTKKKNNSGAKRLNPNIRIGSEILSQATLGMLRTYSADGRHVNFLALLAPRAKRRQFLFRCNWNILDRFSKNTQSIKLH